MSTLCPQSRSSTPSRPCKFVYTIALCSCCSLVSHGLAFTSLCNYFSCLITVGSTLLRICSSYIIRTCRPWVHWNSSIGAFPYGISRLNCYISAYFIGVLSNLLKIIRLVIPLATSHMCVLKLVSSSRTLPLFTCYFKAYSSFSILDIYSVFDCNLISNYFYSSLLASNYAYTSDSLLPSYYFTFYSLLLMLAYRRRNKVWLSSLRLLFPAILFKFWIFYFPLISDLLFPFPIIGWLIDDIISTCFKVRSYFQLCR